MRIRSNTLWLCCGKLSKVLANYSLAYAETANYTQLCAYLINWSWEINFLEWGAGYGLAWQNRIKPPNVIPNITKRERVPVLHQRVLGGEGLNQNADTNDALEGGGYKTMTCWHFEGKEVGEMKDRASIAVKCWNSPIKIWISSSIMPLFPWIQLQRRKYIPYYNRKAYFDDLKHVVKVIKQLAFFSSITSAN